MEKEIGLKIKEVRNDRGFTIKELSERTGLSMGYLSQAERGMSSLSIVSLKVICEVLEIDLSCFFAPPRKSHTNVIHSYEQEVFRVDESNYVYYSLAGEVEGQVMEPMLFVLPPNQNREEIIPYSHDGEEFIYVLEGVLTAFIGDKEYQLLPGDTIHIASTMPHNWGNFTNKLVKLLTVNTPIFLTNRSE